MDVLIFLVAPSILAIVCGALWLRSLKRWYLLCGLGLLLAFAFVLFVYLRSPVDYRHDSDGCSECEQYWGRWWEPGFTALFVGLDYVLWMAGLAFGGALRLVAAAVLRR